jgi:lipopolysaccharide export system protein LptA
MTGRVERRVVIAVAFGVLGLTWSELVPALAAAPAPARLEISADEMTVDSGARTARASGHVRISDGRTVATADRATLFHGEGRGVLAGQARVRSLQGELEGREITISYTTRAITRIVARGTASLDAQGALTSAQLISITPATEMLTAEREVTVFVEPDIVGTGARLTYERPRQRVVLEGRARVQSRDGFLEADRLEGFQGTQHVIVTGHVNGKFRDLEVRSDAAEIFHKERRAVFSGGVQLTQPGRRLAASRVTVWYETNRVVAEGQTSVRIEPQP